MLQPPPGHLGRAQELDFKAHIGGVVDVLDGDILDAFQRDPGEIDLRAKGDGGQDGQLMGCINAAHIKLRIGFEIAQPVSLREDLLIGETRALHAGQDVVARAVHHPHDAGDRVARKPFGERLDDGNAARDGGLETDELIVLFRQFGQGLSVHGQHRFIGGDHVFACFDRGLGGGFGGAIFAAHEFDKHVDIVALGQLDRVVFPRIGVKVHPAIF